MKAFTAIRPWAIQTLRNSKVGSGIGLTVSALAGAPMPLAQLSLIGPLIATCAAGIWGGRAAAAVGFVSYLMFGQPSVLAAVAAVMISMLIGWGVPALVMKSGGVDPKAYDEEGVDDGASAIVIDCEGFTSIDHTYGPGSSKYVFNLLHRALKFETRASDLVVEAEGQELILVLDGASHEAAQAVMERVERRFGAWLTDAGYECNLSVGLSNMGQNEDEYDMMLRAARRAQNSPYLD